MQKCRQSILPLPELSRKIEGDSVRRVVRVILLQKTNVSARVCELHVLNVFDFEMPIDHHTINTFFCLKRIADSVIRSSKDA